MPIPFQGEPIQAFNQGIGQGNELFRSLLARKQMQEQVNQHKENLAIQQMQQNRLREMMEPEMAYKIAKAREAMGNADLMDFLMGNVSEISPNPSLAQQSSFGKVSAVPMKTQIGLPSPRGGFESVNPEREISSFMSGPNGVQNANQASRAERAKNILIMLGKIKESPSEAMQRELMTAEGIENIKRNAAIYNPTPVEIQQAKSPSEKEYEKGFAEMATKSYGDAVKDIGVLENQSYNLNRMLDAVKSYPNAGEVIGPINKFLTNIVGNKEEQKILGDLMVSSGNIILDSLKQMTGTASDKDAGIINSMKPSANDPYGVFLGKLEAMSELNDLTKKRKEIYADLVYEKMPQHKAAKEAEKQTPFDSVDKKYKKIISNAAKLDDFRQGKSPKFKSQQEIDEFFVFLPQKDAEKFIASGGRGI